MSAQHHHPEDESLIRRFIDECAGTAPRQYPLGRLSHDDHGETAFAIAADKDNKIVRIQFSKPMDWLGLDAVSARKLAIMLNEKANEICPPQTIPS